MPEIAGHLDDKLEEYREALGTELAQTRVLGLMQRHMEDDAIVVGAAGSLPGDLQRIWLPKHPDTYHLEYGYSCMGYEIAAAIGAKIAAPEQPVYAMVGDGSYLMLHSELQTAIQENVKITILSRPAGNNSWNGKPAGILGVSTGNISTAIAQQHLRICLASLNMPTMNQPECYLKWFEGMVDEQHNFAPKSQAFIQAWVDTYCQFIIRNVAN